MSQPAWLEILGYAASVLIAASLLMRSIVRLRVVNMAGAATFSLYGFLIGSLPVGLLNLATALINVYQLFRLRHARETFRIIEVSPDSEYLRYFLEFQRDDIAKFVPSFRYDPASDTLALVVLRDITPAGVLLGQRRGETLEVHLDYVIPQFRDLKVGRFLFVEQADFFRRLGVREILSRGETKAHAKYLERIGYAPVGDGRTFRLGL